MKNMIQLDNLIKNFGSVNNVNIKELTVYQGEIYGFLGPNGAGKSTTMKMILSLLNPTSGQIKVMGKPISNNLSYLDNIGSMIEEPSYYPNLTAYENLLVFQKMIGFDKDNIKSTLELVGLWKKENKKKLVSSYSLGMKQRLSLAFALVKKPKILLLDEPTNGLDPSGIREIRQLITKLAKDEGITIFISSHILSEIEQIADRVGIINHGKLVYEGEINKIKANEWIEIEGIFDIDKIKEYLSSLENLSIIYLGKNLIKLANIHNDLLASIVSKLVYEGNSIFRVERKKENLETIFLNLTKEV